MAQPQTIARPYAKALFDLAEDNGQQQRWQEFLQAAASLAQSAEVMQNLHAPNFSAELEKWLNEWLTKTRNEKLSEQERNFLHLLESHDRMQVLPEIAELFYEQCSASHNQCIAHVKSAQVLDDNGKQVIIKLLEKKTGKKIALEIEEVPKLMAGVVIEYEGQVIDQSLQGRLRQFARKLDD